MKQQPAQSPLDESLIALHESYVWQLNAAVSAGRDGLASDVADEFPDEAAELLARSLG